MSPNPQSEEALIEKTPTEETNVSCELNQCPPSHRLARRVSLGIIAALTFLIFAAGIWLLMSNNS